MERTADGQPARLLAFDGLRAVAVALVVLQHAGYNGVVDGVVGVHLFFALSGFLITSILLREWGRTGGVSFGGFYARRVRRLLPALVLVIAAVMVFDVLIDRGGPFRVPYASVPAVLLYSANWYAIVEGGRALGPFAHTWTLSVEEQFYVVWPLVLVGLGLRGGRVRWIVPLCVAGSAAALVSRLVAVNRGQSLERLFMGTDAVADQLLLACALAVVVTTGSEAARERIRRYAAVAWPVAVAFVAYAAFGRRYVPPGWMSSWRYPVEQTVLAASSATLIAYLVLVPHTRIARALSTPWLAYVGVISYGIYLWHVPLFQIVRANVDDYSRPLWLAVVSLATLAIASASYRFVEQPIRMGGQRVRAPVTGTTVVPESVDAARLAADS